MKNLEDNKGPAVKFPPPLIFFGLLFFTFQIHQKYPLSLGVPQSIKITGLAVMLLGVVIILLTAIAFLRAKTCIEPWKPTTKIITTGLYAWSRNPIYTAFTLISIGCGVTIDSVWVFISFLPSAILVYHIAIKKEERYLQSKFGQEYLNYKHRVRRWL